MVHNPNEVASEDVVERCADWLVARSLRGATTVLGVSGAQGSGKTTLSERLARRLAHLQLPATTLSLDDFYLTRSEREKLARDRHPLFVTRGVPGTHDVRRLRDALVKLRAGQGARVPVFDKARDDRSPDDREIAAMAYRFVLLEGWCLGIPPESEGELCAPVNELEARDDATGEWRRAVNEALATDYRELFRELDALLVLLAPSFEVVYRWRAQQERALAGRQPGSATMDQARLERFIMHFERLTRHALKTLPGRADALLELDSLRRVTHFTLA